MSVGGGPRYDKAKAFLKENAKTIGTVGLAGLTVAAAAYGAHKKAETARDRETFMRYGPAVTPSKFKPSAVLGSRSISQKEFDAAIPSQVRITSPGKRKMTDKDFEYMALQEQSGFGKTAGIPFKGRGSHVKSYAEEQRMAALNSQMVSQSRLARQANY